MSLKYAILGLLDEEPRYGYEIKQEFDHTMGDLWPVSYGQLYPTLKRLTQEELVTVKVVQGKKAVDKHVYSITAEGKTAFLSWLGRKNKKMITSIKDEFSLSLFFMERMDQEVMTLMLEQLHDKSVRKLEKIQAVSRVNQEHTPFYRKLLMRKMELFVEAEELWLRELRHETKQRNRDKLKAP